MDARSLRTVLGTALLLLVSMGAQYRSANFIIETADPRFAQMCGETAEKFRRELAVEWLGEAMPNWSAPCPVTILVGPQMGAGGQTSFVFDRGEVFGWRMSIQGSAERLLDSVIPHEVTHMIFASHFRQPLPRWADEGGATSVEHVSERNKHRRMLDQFLRTGRGIPFSRMFAMTEYPPDVMPLYAQGYSLVEYLIQTGGRRKYITFLDDAMKSGDWPGAVRRNYGSHDLGQLQNNWLAWVKQGSPINRQPDNPAISPSIMLASNTSKSNISLAGRLVPLKNLSPGNVPQTNPNALAGVSPPQNSVYAPRTMPLEAKAAPQGFSGARTDLAKDGSHPGPLPWRQGIQSGNQVAVAPVVLSADGWRTRGSGNLAEASVAAPSTSALNATQVAHPQAAEGPKQTILEWNRR